jgi:hypothetical protein
LTKGHFCLVIGTAPLNHTIFGCGCPVTLHVRVNVSFVVTFTSICCSISAITGGTAKEGNQHLQFYVTSHKLFTHLGMQKLVVFMTKNKYTGLHPGLSLNTSEIKPH